MLNVSLFVLADRAIIDRHNNRLSIIDVFEGLRSVSFPVFAPRLAIVVASRKEAGDPPQAGLTVQFAVNGDVYLKVPLTVDFQGTMTNRAILTVEGFLIPSAGLLTATLLENDRQLAQLAVEIGTLDPPKVVVAPEPPTEGAQQ